MLVKKPADIGHLMKPRWKLLSFTDFYLCTVDSFFNSILSSYCGNALS